MQLCSVSCKYWSNALQFAILLIVSVLVQFLKMQPYFHYADLMQTCTGRLNMSSKLTVAVVSSWLTKKEWLSYTGDFIWATFWPSCCIICCYLPFNDAKNCCVFTKEITTQIATLYIHHVLMKQPVYRSFNKFSWKIVYFYQNRQYTVILTIYHHILQSITAKLRVSRNLSTNCYIYPYLLCSWL